MRTIHRAGILLALAVALPCAAFGAEDTSPNAATGTGNENAGAASPVTSLRSDATFMGAAVDAGTLDRYRGGSDSIGNATNVINTMQLHGAVKDNVAVDVVTGSNTITDGAFANASGIPTVIQNTGANVLIQNALIVNLQFK